MLFLFLAFVLSAGQERMELRRQLADELKAHPEPAVETLADMAKVDAALRTPESLWRFVTAPETDWADRIVAAQRGKLPISFLPRFAKADGALAREAALHAWGMERFIPRYSQIAYFPAVAFHGARTRKILGREWTMPDGIADEPLTYEEKTNAPWPWQVQQALAVLDESFFDAKCAAEFWDTVLTLPRGTVEEAAYFQRLTYRFAVLVRRIDPRVIQAWREIGLREGDFIDQRPAIAYVLDAIGLCSSGDEYRYGEVMMADWAEQWSGRDIGVLVFRLKKLSAPPVAVEVLARRIDALAVENTFTRGYSARYFLEAVDPAALPESGANPNDPEGLEGDWSAFRRWYEAHYDELREAALDHERILIRYR